MQRSHMRDRLTPAQRKMQIVNVEMNNVELCCTLEHAFEHHRLVGQFVDALVVQTQRALASRHQPRLGHRVSAREKRHLVTLVDQFLGEVRYNPFRTSVIFRRYAFKKRRHLSNSHNDPHPP